MQMQRCRCQGCVEQSGICECGSRINNSEKSDSIQISPDLPGKEWVDGIKPIVHFFVEQSLKEISTVLCDDTATMNSIYYHLLAL